MRTPVKAIAGFVCSLLFLGWSASALVTLPSGKLTLEWNYPSNNDASISFYLLATNDISAPITNWPVLWSGSYSNTILTNGFDGVAFTNHVLVQIQPGQMFFVMYASNFWGVSTTSNIASTPPLNSQIYMSIHRTN